MKISVFCNNEEIGELYCDEDEEQAFLFAWRPGEHGIYPIVLYVADDRTNPILQALATAAAITEQYGIN